MFRLVIISFIALRVIACPALCAVDGGNVSSMGVEEIGCCRSESDQTAHSGSNDSSHSGTPCQHDGGCTVQVTPDSAHRSVVTDVALSLDFIPLCLDTRDLSSSLARRYGKQRSSRHEALSGRDLRLAYASLLI